MSYNTFRRLLKNTPPCSARTYSFYPHPSVPDWAVDNHPFPLASMPSAKYWRGKASQPYPLSSYKLKSHSFPFIFLDISLCSLALIKTTVLLVYGLRIVWNIWVPLTPTNFALTFHGATISLFYELLSSQLWPSNPVNLSIGQLSPMGQIQCDTIWWKWDDPATGKLIPDLVRHKYIYSNQVIVHQFKMDL